MKQLRWTLGLLVLSLGCRSASIPIVQDDAAPQTTAARLVSAESRERESDAPTTQDPFVQLDRQVDLNELGRAAVSDSGWEETAARDAMLRAGQPVSATPQELFPHSMRNPDDAAAEQAAQMIFQAQFNGAAGDETESQRRLRELELELQFTEDHAKQDTLALEIARLRRQQSRDRR